MGAITGDLSVLSITNLVQALVLDRSEGILTIESGNDCRRLRVTPAGIRLVRGSQRCHRLERLLRRFGRLSPGSADDTAILSNRKLVARLVQEWMFEEICELFTWSRGTFHFEKAAPGEILPQGPFAPFAADCDVTTVALEAARWADELPRIKAAIRDLRQIPVSSEPQETVQKSSMDPEALDDVLRLIDGNRSVIHILQLSVFPRFIVLQVLHRLILQGAIRMSTPGEAAMIPAPVAAAA